MDTPQCAVVAVLKEHAKWQKQQEKRHTSEYLKYKYVNKFEIMDIKLPLTLQE